MFKMKSHWYRLASLIFFLLVIAIYQNTPNLSWGAEKVYSGKAIKTGIWRGKRVDYVDGQILIGLKQGVTVNIVRQVLVDAQTTLVADFDILGIGMVEVKEGSDIFAKIRVLNSHPLIQFAEPNLIIKALATNPNDEFYRDGHQWALNNTGQSPPSGRVDADIDAPEAWDVETGSPNVIIAVLDSGIPIQNDVLSHPDLDDTNKFILGPDYVNGDDIPNDDYGHGTHVTGIISAETNNSIGIAGVSWGCNILVIKILDDQGNGTDLGFEQGVVYAVDYGQEHGVRVVVNCSIRAESPTDALKRAVEYAYFNNCVIVAGSGNDGKKNNVQYPAAYPEVIAVGATDHNDKRADYSDYGPELDVVAPGGHGGQWDEDDIYSTTPNYHVTLKDWSYNASQSYGYMAGTSMATPHVSGLAALMLSDNPGLTNRQVRTYLWATADKVPGMNGLFWTEKYGYGRINAYRALTEYVPPTPDLTVPSVTAPSSAKPGDSIDVSFTVENQGDAPSGSFNIRISLSTKPHGTHIGLGDFSMDSIDAGSSVSDTKSVQIPNDVSQGDYYVTVYAEEIDYPYVDNNIGSTHPNTISITKDTIPPQVSLGAPNGGEKWAVGSQQDIKWNATDNIGIDHIDIQFSSDNAVSWSNVVLGIANSGKYTWTVPDSVSDVCKVKVIAYDAAGNYGFDVSDGCFSIIPSCPILPSPTLFEPVVSGDDYTISWSSVSGANSYILQEDTNNSFSSPTEYPLTQTSKFFSNKPSGTYYYRVCAVNQCGRGNWSNVVSHTQHLDTEPSKPVAIYPEDGATIDDNFVTLQWESHGGNGQLRYTVYFAHSNPMGYPPIAEDITQTSYKVSDLDYNSSYYWQVYVYDEDGDDKLSDVFKFTVAPENNPPTGSVLINNGDATTVSFVVTLTLSATDTQSEVTSMRFSNDGNNWSGWYFYQTLHTWNLSDYHYGGNSSNGIKNVYAQFKDSSGNISSTYTDTIEKIDGTSGSIILNGQIYETIRDAMAAAQAGDTIYLTEGIYNIRGELAPPRHPDRYVGIVLKDNVNLIGAGASKTTIIGTDSAWTIIDGNNSIISGLTIINEDDWPPVYLESNSSRINYCVVKNSTTFGGGISVWSENSQISNNLIINNEVGIDFHGQRNVKIYNNTIANNSVHGISGALGEGGHEIRNNIICYNSNTGVYIHDGFTFTHNDVYGNGKNYAGDGWMDDQTGINGNISEDPLFVNPAAGDYKLMAGSPCINAGTNVGIPANGSPDMGAFEYNGTGTIRVESNHPDAAFTITGPEDFTGSGTDWSVSNVPIGIYSITFVPIPNHNTPYYTSKVLECNQTVIFDGNYYPDQESPIVTISINYDEYSTADRFVDITLSASDEVAGLDGAEMQFSNNGSDWSIAEPYSSLKQDWDLGSYGGDLASGVKVVHAKVSDGLGNWTEAIIDEILYVPNRRILSVPDEFQTIQVAIDAAQEGDMVWVAPGTYPIEQDLGLRKGVTLQGSGWEKTLLNLQTTDDYTIIVADETKIDGFTLKWGYPNIDCNNVSSIISNNFIRGMISIRGNSKVIIRNNIFDGEEGWSKAIHIIDVASQTIIENNTIVDYEDGIVIARTSPIIPGPFHIQNNIIANSRDYAFEFYMGPEEHKFFFSTFNDYWNNAKGIFGSAPGWTMPDVSLGVGDMEADPSFTDAPNKDFSLRPDSPCIDSGNPEAKYNDADSTPNDRGAYGGPCTNTNPNASFTIDPETGGLGKEFTFDAGLSSDRETESNRLNFRWDWENDGVFDTSFSDNPQATHSYQTTGEKTITLQVRDEGGFVGSTSETVTVINQPPNTPSNPNPADNAKDQPINIQLSWQGGDPDSIDTVTYDVYFGTNSEPPLVSDDQTETTYTPETLDHQKFYYWKIVATDNHGASATGPVWSFVTETESVPEAPSNLSAEAISSNQIDLSWQDNSTNELGFKIERKQGADGTYIQIHAVDAGITEYSDTDLNTNTTYFYRVRACNKTGDSEYSNEASATTPINYGDISGDGNITAYDASLALQYVIGLIELSPDEQDAADVTGDDIVSALDAAMILQYTVGLIANFPVDSAPVAPALNLPNETKLLAKAIEQLETIYLAQEQKQVLEQLKNLVFSQLIPKHTALFQNYPNPFNPETWIPFQIATDTPVTIHIYNAKGQLIRIISLGYKNAGIYVTKDKAAYWNGRNNMGERVSSGIYFVTLRTGKEIITRKMYIVK